MLIDVYHKIKSVRSLFPGDKVPLHEQRRAVYDAAVAAYGVDAVGEFSEYKVDGAFWTYENCKEAAAKCANRKEYSEKYPSAHQMASKKKWLIEFFGESVTNIKWTVEALKKVAAPYKTRSQFEKHQRTASKAARNKGLLNELFPVVGEHFGGKASEMEFVWTYEECKKDAAKYATQAEWERGSKTAHRKAAKKGWIKDFYQPKKYQELTLEDCMSIALKYQHRGDWGNDDPRSYAWARKNGHLELCAAHMTPKRKPKPFKETKKLLPPPTYEECKADALLYKNRSEWNRKSYRFYYFAKKHNIIGEVAPHMPDDPRKWKMGPGYWTRERLIEFAKTCRVRNEFDSRRDSAKRIGVLDECYSYINGGEPGGFRYSDDELLASAKKYQTLTDWIKHEYCQRRAALKRGKQFDKLCRAHMTLDRSAKTFEQCLESALKHQTKKQWLDADSKAVGYARGKGWYKKITKHMTINHRTYMRLQKEGK